jgi:hypothetical protein
MTTKELNFYVDLFLLEVGEGHMPAAESMEAKAYEEWRMIEEAKEYAEEQARVRAAKSLWRRVLGK